MKYPMPEGSFVICLWIDLNEQNYRLLSIYGDTKHRWFKIQRRRKNSFGECYWEDTTSDTTEMLSLINRIADGEITWVTQVGDVQ